MSYLYADGNLYYFMDTETFEQIPVSKELLGDNLNYIKEGMVCRIVSYKGTIFGIEPPTFVELLVTECEPGVRGDTATNATKTAKVESGYEVRVPLFINEGDIIRIDTRTGDYMDRVKN